MERAIAAAAAKHIQAPASQPTAATKSSQHATASDSKPPPAAPLTTPTSSALAYIPAELPVESGVSGQDLTIRPIHPWDLTSPIPISNCQPIFYDAATQEYFLFTFDGALLLHKTKTITIPKRAARKFLYDWPSGDDDAVEVLGSRLKIPKSSSPSLLLDKVIVYHAVHDSVIVKRRSGNTGLFKFCVDKVVKVTNPGFLLKDVYTKFVRPGFGCVLSCTCEQVYYYGKTVYCPTCTSYRTPLCINLKHLTPKAPYVVGKITMPVPIARTILYHCIEPGTTKLSVPRAYRALSKCFDRYDIYVSRIPVEEGELVGNLLRDCLFVEAEGANGGSSSSVKGGKREKMEGEMQKVPWATFFNIPDKEIPRGGCQGRLSGQGLGAGHQESAAEAGSVTVAAVGGPIAAA
ncbi:hypothetical protein BJX63DRAFT_106876 [Aspergillus granulosus]|uniref:Uncharacterized protein n=1 Tax=Aspergillus granulosus TaxID=176169 RepID=A0ABR4GVN0_9EURO